MAGVFSTPRPMPDQKLPFVAGAAVIALALPIFLAAGWDLRGWVIGGDALGRVAAPRGATDAPAARAWVTSPAQAWWALA